MTQDNGEEPFPLVPKDLLEKLEELYPQQAPDINWTDRFIWTNKGAQDLVAWLRNKYNEQNDNILTRKVI